VHERAQDSASCARAFLPASVQASMLRVTPARTGSENSMAWIFAAMRE